MTDAKPIEPWQVAAKERLQLWCARYKRVRGAWCAHWLVNARSGLECKWGLCKAHIPYQDHTTTWVRKSDGKRVLLTQPYGLSFEHLQQLVAWCRTWGLIMSLPQGIGDWHYPGRVLHVEIEKEG